MYLILYMLNISLSNLNRTHYGPLYIGTVKRLATATSVKFIDSTHLCTTHLVGMYLDLYEFDYDKKIFTLLDKIDTTYNNNLCITDLIDYNDDLILTSNFDKGTQTLYKIENNKLFLYKCLPVYCNKLQYCHGVKFYNKNIICFTYNREFVISFVDYLHDRLLYQISYLPNFNPKDIAFINDTKMLIYYSTSNVIDKSDTRKFKSRIVYLDVNLENKTHNILDSFDIVDCHGDCIVVCNNIIFVNNQTGDCVYIFNLQNNKICLIDTLDGYDKPHGLDVNYDNQLIAVSNYGDNTIKLRKIPQNILDFMVT